MIEIIFKLGRNISTRNSFNRHELSLVEIKDFNALTDNKSIFNQPIKRNKRHENWEGSMKNLLKCQETIIIRQEIY